MPYINGQFIDKSQVGSTGIPNSPSAMTNIPGGQTTVGGQTGDSNAKLKTLLGLYALSKGNPTGAWSILSAAAPDTTGTTPAEKSRAESGLAQVNATKSISPEILKRTGTMEALKLDVKLNFPGGILQQTVTPKEAELADLESKYFLITQAVLTAVQGSRPSDYDVKSYQNHAGPSIKLPYYINEQRIRNLDGLLRSKTGQAALPERPSLDSFNK